MGWSLRPPESGADIARALRDRNPWHSLSSIYASTVDLRTDKAWVYTQPTSDMAKDLYGSLGKGIKFGRRNGFGLGITYNEFNSNFIEQAAKFTLYTGLSATLKFKPNSGYKRLGGIKNISKSIASGLKTRCVIQIIAMSEGDYKKRDDGIFFLYANYIDFEAFLNILQETGVLNTRMLRKQEERDDRRKWRSKDSDGIVSM